MKKVFLTLAASVMLALTAHAADIFFYQGQFTANLDSFKTGLADAKAFERLVTRLDTLQAQLSSETSIKKKEPLLSDIKSVHSFIGEISPSAKSYALTIAQKKNAMNLLGVQDKMFNDSSFCLPIYELRLWNNKYVTYTVENHSDSMMYIYKLAFLVQKKYSNYWGSVDAGVQKQCARGILKTFGDVRIVKFNKIKCDEELNVVKYIQPEVVQPKIEKYPEPDYLSPQQKQALKKKEKEQIAKDKEKAKKLAEKEKELKKKEQEKEKAAAKLVMEKERSAKQKESQQAKDTKMKEMEKEKAAKAKEAEAAKKAAEEAKKAADKTKAEEKKALEDKKKK